MIVFLVDNQDEDIFQTPRDFRLFLLNYFHDITHVELFLLFHNEDFQIGFHIENTVVQASIDPDLDHAGDDISSIPPLEIQSTQSRKKPQMPLEGKLSMIFIWFI